MKDDYLKWAILSLFYLRYLFSSFQQFTVNIVSYEIVHGWIWTVVLCHHCQLCHERMLEWTWFRSTMIHLTNTNDYNKNGLVLCAYLQSTNFGCNQVACKVGLHLKRIVIKNIITLFHKGGKCGCFVLVYNPPYVQSDFMCISGPKPISLKGMK